MSAVCLSCYAPQDQGLLCATCTQRLDCKLADVPAVVGELEVTLARQARMEQATKGGLAHERNGFHSAASIAAGSLENTLTTWARDVIGDWLTTPAAVYRNRDTTQAGPYCLDCHHASCQSLRVTRKADVPPSVIAAHALRCEMPTIRKHPAAGELVDQITSAVQQAWQEVDRAVNRIRFFVGPCFEADEDGEHCPGEVWAFIPTEDARPPRMECRANPDHRWTSSQFYRAGKRIHDRAEHLKRQAVGAA
jgi:hypothetical protein